MDDVETTQREAAEITARVDQVLREAAAALEQSQALTGRVAGSGSAVGAFMARQPKALQEAFERERRAVLEELEREIPCEVAVPVKKVRVKPSRQMV